jgi:hypothetical protein
MVWAKDWCNHGLGERLMQPWPGRGVWRSHGLGEGFTQPWSGRGVWHSHGLGEGFDTAMVWARGLAQPWSGRGVWCSYNLGEGLRAAMVWKRLELTDHSVTRQAPLQISDEDEWIYIYRILKQLSLLRNEWGTKSCCHYPIF